MGHIIGLSLGITEVGGGVGMAVGACLGYDAGNVITDVLPEGTLPKGCAKGACTAGGIVAGEWVGMWAGEAIAKTVHNHKS